MQNLFFTSKKQGSENLFAAKRSREEKTSEKAARTAHQAGKASIAERQNPGEEANPRNTAREDVCKSGVLPPCVILLHESQLFSSPLPFRKRFSDDSLLKLADSIRHHGIISPLIVRYKDEAANQERRETPKYEIVCGERRIRAARLLGISDIPCIILPSGSKGFDEISISDNILSEPLDMFEQANAIFRFIDMNRLTKEEAAKRLSCGMTYISGKLTLLRLSSGEREIVIKYGLTEKQARMVLRISERSVREEALAFIASRKLSEAATEDYVDRITRESDEFPAMQNQRSTYIIKDMRLFLNTLERSVNIMKRAGINVEAERGEHEQYTEIVVKIPRKPGERLPEAIKKSEKSAPTAPKASERMRFASGEQIALDIFAKKE